MVEQDAPPNRFPAQTPNIDDNSTLNLEANLALGQRQVSSHVSQYKKMQHRLKQLALLIFIVSSGVLAAREVRSQYEDTPLSIKDGQIAGLPKKYSPASFDLKKLTLSIGGRMLVFPYTLREQLMYDANKNPFGEMRQMKPHPYTYIFAWSSYHQLDDIRPCISITIVSKNKNLVYKLLIDMDKLKFFYADVIVKDVGRFPLDLDRVPYGGVSINPDLLPNKVKKQ